MGAGAIRTIAALGDDGLGANAAANEQAAPRAAEQAKRAEVERKAIVDAQKIVAIWNARQAGGRALWFYTRDHQQVTSAPARREFFRPRRSS
jgi:hypothetical protein